MPTPTNSFPHETPALFLTDGGLETTLVFIEGFDLPCFAAFPLLEDEKGLKAIRDYYLRYLHIAREFHTHFILETPTWRANPDWLARMDYRAGDLARVNESAVELMKTLREDFGDPESTILISGCVGPRGDGYKADQQMDAATAEAYHRPQIDVFRQASVDLVSAITMTYVEEAIGITRAAAAAGLPVVISFTVETDGLLPCGLSLREAIETVDGAVTPAPIYYMINCAHPRHFGPALEKGLGKPWTQRIRGLRANASCKSHAELDESTSLDRGDPEALGLEHKQLKKTFTHLNVFGGCCGTDEVHVLQIARQVSSVD